jgi:signal transduction histidine kinase
MEAWLERMYARHGARYLWRAGQFVLVLLLLTLVPVASWPPARYEGLSFGQYAFAMGVSFAFAPLLVLVGFLVSRDAIRVVEAWHAGDRSAQRASQLRRVAFEQPRRLVLTFALFAVPVCTPIAVLLLALPSHHTTVVDFAELAIAFQTELALLLMAGYVVLEIAWRPVRASLEGVAIPTPPPGHLAQRLVVPLLSLVMMSCVYVGALFSSHRSAGAGGLFVILGVALGITAIWAAVLLPLLSISVLRPIRDLIRGHRAVGAERLDTHVPVTTDDELGELATSFNEMTDELRRHTEQLRASRERIVAAADDERRRIERDIHDGAQQQLVLLNLKLGLLAQNLDSDPDAAAATVGELRGDVGRALTELRDLARGLYPPVLESDGLPGALHDAVDRAAVPAQLDCDGAGRYRPDVEAAVYFCCTEALQNAAKHAGPGARANVRLAERHGVLYFEVADNGRGLDGNPPGTGMQNMADRIVAVGGELSVDSAPGYGTSIAARIPVAGA